MKVNCIHCGHNFTLDESYADYSGIVRCSTCGGVLDIQTRDGMVRGVRPGSLAPPAVSSAPAAPAATPAASPEELAKLLAQIEALTAQTQAANVAPAAAPTAVAEAAPEPEPAAAKPATRSKRAGSKTVQDL